jgi:aspartate/methionine/tyrosine aminotransferase
VVVGGTQLNTPAVSTVTVSDLCYGPMQGRLQLRRALAAFLRERTRAPAPLDPDAVCVLNGAGTVLDTLVQVRLGDASEAA